MSYENRQSRAVWCDYTDRRIVGQENLDYRSRTNRFGLGQDTNVICARRIQSQDQVINNRLALALVPTRTDLHVPVPCDPPCANCLSWPDESTTQPRITPHHHRLRRRHPASTTAACFCTTVLAELWCRSDQSSPILGLLDLLSLCSPAADILLSHTFTTRHLPLFDTSKQHRHLVFIYPSRKAFVFFFFAHSSNTSTHFRLLHFLPLHLCHLGLATVSSTFRILCAPLSTPSPRIPHNKHNVILQLGRDVGSAITHARPSD